MPNPDADRDQPQSPAEPAVEQPAVTEDPEPPTKSADVAMIFVQGLDLGVFPRKDAVGVMKNIAVACNVQTPTAAEFSTHFYTAAFDEKPQTGLVATLQRTENGRKDPVLDLHSYEWSDTFLESWREQNVFIRLLKVIFAFLSVRSFIRFFRTAGRKNPMGRTQLALAASMVVVVAVFGVITAYAAVQTGITAYEKFVEDDAADEPATSVPSTTGTQPDATTVTDDSNSDDIQDDTGGGADDDGWDLWPTKLIAIAGTLLLVFSKKLRKFIVGTGETLAAAHGYLEIEEGVGRASLGLVQTIEQIAAESDPTHVVVLAYSFGSLVAIDTLFPTTGPPVAATDRVTSLVTIGTPFDFARAIRPKWTDERNAGPGTLTKWINVFSRIDLLGSNFREKTKGEAVELAVAKSIIPGESESPISQPTDNLAWGTAIENSVKNLIAFHGFMGHGLYWSQQADQRSAFELVVKPLFENTPILASPGPA